MKAPVVVVPVPFAVFSKLRHALFHTTPTNSNSVYIPSTFFMS